MNAESTFGQGSLEQNSGGSVTSALSKALPPWVQKIQEAQRIDQRAQPWKAALGHTHDKAEEGEDLINLQLPNHVQCGSMAA